MQITGSGIICTGYLYLNPSISSYSFNISSTDNKSKTFSPPVSNGVKITFTNSDYYESITFTWILSGTYVSVAYPGTTSNPSGQVGLNRQTSKTEALPYIRYA